MFIAKENPGYIGLQEAYTVVRAIFEKVRQVSIDTYLMVATDFTPITFASSG